MDYVGSIEVTEWLTLEEMRKLLQTGELLTESPRGKLRLFINFNDRQPAKQMVEPGAKKG